MLKSQYLSASRHGVFYFRFSIPQTLHPERKQTSVRLSLNTRCPREALQLSRMLGYVGEHILSHAGIRAMQYQQIRDVLSDRFRRSLERHVERQAQFGPMSELDKMATENTRDFAAQALLDQDYSYVGEDREINRVIDSYALPIQPKTKNYELLRTEYLKALRDFCSTILKQDDALSGYDFSNSIATTSKQKARKLADTINEYCEEKLRLKQWRPNTAKSYRAQFDLLLRMIGKDASLHLSPEVASDVKARLLRLPKNIAQNQSYREVDIADLIELDLPESKRLSVVTVANHMRTYSTLYEWAIEKKRTSENNFSAYVDDVKKAHAPRDQFNAEQTQRIFTAVKDAKKPHQKWGVLIAFYTGARLNEIAQLETHDIKQVDDIWCFHFTDDGEDKRLKNQASKRIIPVHSELIALGFLDYHKAAGKGRLFPALTFHPKDGYGRNLGRWFNASLLRKQLEITSRKLVFHSIRHTVAQQLRNNKVVEATLKDILGHSHVGVTMNTYAKNLDKAVMQEAIETLRYA